MNRFRSLMAIAIIGALALVGCEPPGGGGAAGTSALDYVILAKSAVSNVPTSSVTGNIGLSPAATSFITGFSLVNATGYATSAQVTGNLYAADMAPPTNTNLTTAVTDMLARYNAAAGLANSGGAYLNLGAGTIGATTPALAPGVYTWTTALSMTGDITISGSATDTWTFQVQGTLTVAADVDVLLTGGALAKNIVWQVSGATSIGTSSVFKGIILDQSAITLGVGSTLIGRALAQTAVNLSGTNTVTAP
jgi:hypothetical protein